MKQNYIRSDTDNYRRTHALSFSWTAPKQKASSGDNSQRRCKNVPISRRHCTGTSHSKSDNNVTDVGCGDITIESTEKSTQRSLKFDDLESVQECLQVSTQGGYSERSSERILADCSTSLKWRHGRSRSTVLFPEPSQSIETSWSLVHQIIAGERDGNRQRKRANFCGCVTRIALQPTESCSMEQLHHTGLRRSTRQYGTLETRSIQNWSKKNMALVERERSTMSRSCSLYILLTINLAQAITVLAESVNIVQQTSSTLQQRNRSTGQFRHKF